MRIRTGRRGFAALSAAAAVLMTSGISAAQPSRELPAFGADFLWGVASSGFQSEGHAPDSNWSRYIASGATADPYRDSVDFARRYIGDVELAARLGVRVYRVGIEWARLQPAPHAWDEAAFGFYDNVIARILAAGMRPMLTLDHWVYPGWALDRGGWRNPGMVADWLANMRKVVHRYSSRDPLWVTFNEPAAYVGTELRTGGISVEEAPVMVDHIAQAHNEIYDVIHRARPGAQVTSNLGYVAGAETEVNQPIVDRISAKLDFIGVDYYFAPLPQAGESAQGGAEGGPAMWELPVHPEGIYYALRHYARQFPDRPLYVVENGLPTENGQVRPDGYTRADHLRDTVYWLQRAKADGMNVIGYNYWSLTDNYEWGSYAPRFGLYTVDVLTDPTLRRRPTDAVDAYADLIRAGGVRPGYQPTRAPVPCIQIDAPEICTGDGPA
ncbi:glycoside hydrolase family 1 protein [Nocardia abscessus]|uniref:family 1 glycosylhydrolase n=1 Tax=Nocardia TaxID=1817 RepID=UPI00189522BB|nr:MULTISPECIES: family 1 glycosylhydrolase [Nocardia]MBF6221459.1 glycoside hydrolase family 1 protein [Nocardia abscessus]MDE1671667.1 family 1 glycosylhydrolase [Nocardia gipuzkoensis]